MQGQNESKHATSAEEKVVPLPTPPPTTRAKHVSAQPRTFPRLHGVVEHPLSKMFQIEWLSKRMDFCCAYCGKEIKASYAMPLVADISLSFPGWTDKSMETVFQQRLSAASAASGSSSSSSTLPVQGSVQDPETPPPPPEPELVATIYPMFHCCPDHERRLKLQYRRFAPHHSFSVDSLVSRLWYNTHSRSTDLLTTKPNLTRTRFIVQKLWIKRHCYAPNCHNTCHPAAPMLCLSVLDPFQRPELLDVTAPLPTLPRVTSSSSTKQTKTLKDELDALDANDAGDDDGLDETVEEKKGSKKKLNGIDETLDMEDTQEEVAAAIVDDEDVPVVATTEDAVDEELDEL